MLYGKPKEVFKQLVKDHNINTVYTNHDYEPYATQRDTEIKDVLKTKNINFKTFKDQVIFEKSEIVKKDGDPYKVYTPYMRTWKEKFKTIDFKIYTTENYLKNLIKDKNLSNLSLLDIGFKSSQQPILPYEVTPNLIQQYEDTRNFPAKDSTSRLGPHLRFGTVSVRKMVEKAIAETNEIFWQELIWREFFMQILWHFPHTAKNAFKSKYDRIEWRNNEDEFKKWCNGKTGYPFVDAGSGVDAAPYFRIFNPTSQIKKFDKDLEYIKKWVPDFQELTYPQPIVDHKIARERCLKTYKSALN